MAGDKKVVSTNTSTETKTSKNADVSIAITKYHKYELMNLC